MRQVTPLRASLALADSLTINGDVTVGAHVTVHGDATIDHDSADPSRIPDGTVLGRWFASWAIGPFGRVEVL